MFKKRFSEVDSVALDRRIAEIGVELHRARQKHGLTTSLAKRISVAKTASFVHSKESVARHTANTSEVNNEYRSIHPLFSSTRVQKDDESVKSGLSRSSTTGTAVQSPHSIVDSNFTEEHVSDSMSCTYNTARVEYPSSRALGLLNHDRNVISSVTPVAPRLNIEEVSQLEVGEEIVRVGDSISITGNYLSLDEAMNQQFILLAALERANTRYDKDSLEKVQRIYTPDLRRQRYLGRRGVVTQILGEWTADSDGVVLRAPRGAVLCFDDGIQQFFPVNSWAQNQNGLLVHRECTANVIQGVEEETGTTDSYMSFVNRRVSELTARRPRAASASQACVASTPIFQQEDALSMRRRYGSISPCRVVVESLMPSSGKLPTSQSFANNKQAAANFKNNSPEYHKIVSKEIKVDTKTDSALNFMETPHSFFRPIPVVLQASSYNPPMRTECSPDTSSRASSCTQNKIYSSDDLSSPLEKDNTDLETPEEKSPENCDDPVPQLEVPQPTMRTFEDFL